MANDVFPVPEAFARTAHCDAAGYRAMYRRSLEDPDGFWAEQAQRLDWIQTPTRIKDVDFNDNARIRWFEDGVLNVSANCIDRHLATRGDQTAILWEGDDPARTARSPIASCTGRSAGSPTCSRTWGSGRATGSRSTCR